MDVILPESNDFLEITSVEILRLVLTNFFYLSNIRPVSWGGPVEW